MLIFKRKFIGLIDTSPDIKYQILNNRIKNLDSIIYTHEHADQTAGIFEMRPFYWKNKSKIPIYGSLRTIQKSYDFCFNEKRGYRPIMKAKIIKSAYKKEKIKLSIKSFDVIHGSIQSTGYVMDKIAYIKTAIKFLKKFEIFKQP